MTNTKKLYSINYVAYNKDVHNIYLTGVVTGGIAICAYLKGRPFHRMKIAEEFDRCINYKISIKQDKVHME